MNHINDMFRPIFDIGNAFISDFRAEQAGFYRYQMGLINNVDIVGADNVSQFFGRLYAAFGSSAERNVLASGVIQVPAEVHQGLFRLRSTVIDADQDQLFIFNRVCRRDLIRFYAVLARKAVPSVLLRHPLF